MSRYRPLVLIGVGLIAALPFTTRASWSQDPRDTPPTDTGGDVGDVLTVDLVGVGPASFDGDVHDLTPVGMDQAQLDLKEETELPDLPDGPAFAAPRRSAALVPFSPVPAPTPLMNFRGLGRFDVVTGGQVGS